MLGLVTIVASIAVAPITTLDVTSSANCPFGTSLVGSDGYPTPALPGGSWDGDFDQRAGGKSVFLCTGGLPIKQPITSIVAVHSNIKSVPSCPANFERLPVDFNSNASSNIGSVYLCISRRAPGRPLGWLVGSFGENGCPAGFHPVNDTSGQSQAFDYVGRGPSLGILLCAAWVPDSCPPSPPPSGDSPLSELRVAAAARPELACCPSGYARVGEVAGGSGSDIGVGGGISSRSWNGDFNEGASGAYVYLCARYSTTHAQGSAPPISSLVAITTPSAAQPLGHCPAGYSEVSGTAGVGNDLNRRSKNAGAMYLCAGRNASLPPIAALAGSAGSIAASHCPLINGTASAAVEGVASQGGAGRAFDFDPSGVGLRLCAARISH